MPLETGREGTQERYGIKNAPGQSARYGYHPHRKIMKVRPLLILLLFVVSTGILVWIYFAALRGQRAPHRRQWTETLADLDACCRHKHIKSRQYDHFAETARRPLHPAGEGHGFPRHDRPEPATEHRLRTPNARRAARRGDRPGTRRRQPLCGPGADLVKGGGCTP